MKLFSKFIFILIPGLFSLSAFAQNMDQDAMMESWQKSMVPGPEHKMIANMVGE